MDISMFMTNWIWTADWTAEDDKNTHIVYFRKMTELQEVPSECKLKITADSCYKLYINGQFVEKGPQKAINLKEWFVDTVDITAFLKPGKNVAAVEVIRFPENCFSSTAPNTNDSLLRTPVAHLFVQTLGGGENKGCFDAKNGWKACVNRETEITGENSRPAPIHVQEKVNATECFKGWKESYYDDSQWKDAKVKLFFDLSLSDAPMNQVDRTIPFMKQEETRFMGTVCFRDEKGDLTEGDRDGWNNLINKTGVVVIPANTAVTVELAAKYLDCGYLDYSFWNGKNASVETLCSECYGYPKEDPRNPLNPAAQTKGDRTDYKKGKLLGFTSTYKVAGYGTEAAPENYEPFWFRTFRYIQLKITTKDEPLVFANFSYRATGYPLVIKNRPEIKDETMSRIWDISVRTLERCMHETYFDCPFYEQLQYAMDTRNEILYTYTIAEDDRLARQAMEAFKCAQRPDGLINADAPTVKSNVIPGFSIYYLLMVHDHMKYFGDRQLVKDHMATIDGILNFFDNNIEDNGMVGKVGGPIMRNKYWSFIDWSKKWNDNAGVPNATNQGRGFLTMESLLYVYGLQHAAELAKFIGRDGVASEYLSRAKKVQQAVLSNCRGYCVDAAGVSHEMIQDGPGIDEYSAHCQIFAILTDTVSEEEGEKMLLAAINDDNLAQPSVSFMFYLFRALEKVDRYDLTERYWDVWRKMVENNMTTCVENDTDERSDCHAWASLACYELR